PGMLAELRTAHPQAAALAGHAERIPLADATCDAVLVGQAFHWFAVPQAIDEMARVLRPGGVAGLLWNLRDDSVPWVAALSDALGGAPDTVSESRPSLGDEPRAQHPHFGAAERRDFPNPRPFTRQRLLDWASSTSSVAIAEPAQRQGVFDAINRLCDTDPALRGRDTFELPFVTACVRAVRPCGLR
ncbi:MAG: class I SAM-dependent methyltransferase, partial [Streptosporangiaceae bacterium]